MLIRRAVMDDAPAIARVQVDTWRTAYAGIMPDSVLDGMQYKTRAAQWHQNMSSERTFHEVALFNEEIVGFAASGPERDQVDRYDCEIYALYVLQEHQGKGIGKALVQSAMKELKDRGFKTMLIWVLEANHSARAFYERMGGVQIENTLILRVGGTELTEIAYGYNLSDLVP